MKTLIAITLFALVAGSQSAMASSEGPGGYELILPGYTSIEDVRLHHVSFNGASQVLLSNSEGPSGYEGILSGYESVNPIVFSNVSYRERGDEVENSELIYAYDTLR